MNMGYHRAKRSEDSAEQLELYDMMSAILNSILGGWWHWPEDSREPVFDSTEEWLKVYNKVWCLICERKYDEEM